MCVGGLYVCMGWGVFRGCVFVCFFFFCVCLFVCLFVCFYHTYLNSLFYFILSLCSHHEAITIDSVVNAAVGVFSKATGKAPRFRVEGGSNRENLALQNIQVWLCY